MARTDAPNVTRSQVEMKLLEPIRGSMRERYIAARLGCTLLPAMFRFAIVLAAACGGSPPPAPAPVVATTEPPPEVEQEDVRKAELAAAHRERLDEQATALAATCEKPSEPAAQRCEPSCYVPEAADPRAGKKAPRVVEVTHRVCTRGDEGPYVIVDELAGVDVRPLRGRAPKPNKQGTWQAEVEAAVATALAPELARGDVVRVRGTWKSLAHPATRERMRCVTVSRYTRLRRALDACGSTGSITCEAARSHAAHGLNIVRYRLLEARQLHAQGKGPACQQAALEAIAVARGMPRWRQYMTLNTTSWKAWPRYRTRYDGVLDEDTLFATAARLGALAEAVHAECGGPAGAPTAVEQEQSFHTCW
jgi:hypothetical protein